MSSDIVVKEWPKRSSDWNLFCLYIYRGLFCSPWGISLMDDSKSMVKMLIEDMYQLLLLLLYALFIQTLLFCLSGCPSIHGQLNNLQLIKHRWSYILCQFVGILFCPRRDINLFSHSVDETGLKWDKCMSLPRVVECDSGTLTGSSSISVYKGGGGGHYKC